MAKDTEKGMEMEEMEETEETKAYDPWEEVEYKIPRLPGSKNSDVFVRVNDRKYQIKRGVTVKIPRCVAEVLRNSETQDDATADLIDHLTK